MTSPFPAGLVAALKGYAHAGKLRGVQGPAITPAFYCCISGNTVGVAKDPVPVPILDVQVVCPNEAVTMDYSNSWSPTDTIASWEVTWGDGQTSNGLWPGAGSVAHPLGGYVAAGKYDVVLTVTDTLGAEGTGRLQVIVLSCADEDAMDEGDPAGYPAYRWANWEEVKGIATSQQYVWSNDDVLGAGSWAKVESSQLSTSTLTDAKITREPSGLERLFVSRYDGIYTYEVPPSGGTWVKRQDITDLITAAGYNPANYNDVQIVDSLAFVENRPGWGYAFFHAYKNGPLFKGADAIWGVATTFSGWRSIAYSVVIDDMGVVANKLQRFTSGQLAVVQESNGATVYAASGRLDEDAGVDESTLHVSGNYGGSWSRASTMPNYGASAFCSVGRKWAGIVYWSNVNGTYRSGVKIHAENGPMSVSPEDARYMLLMTGQKVIEFTPSTIRQFGGAGADWPHWPGNDGEHFIVTHRNDDHTAYRILWVGDDGVNGQIYALKEDGTMTDVGGGYTPTTLGDAFMARPETEEYLAYP